VLDSREATVNSAEDAMSKLFASAASRLLGDRSQHSDTADANRLLEALNYVTANELATHGRTSESETRHGALLLNAASRFVRVFQLAAPDAPGLVAFGGEFDPAIADPLHAGSPLVGVSGVGLSLQEAFQGCIGEGIEYLSQLQTGSDVLLPSGPGDPVAKLGARARDFLDAFCAHRLRPGADLSWHPVMRLTDRCEVEALLPADLCLRRPLHQREIEPPFPLSNGSAAGTSWDAAALHGMLELIERDAASLWWRGGSRGGSIPQQHEAHIMAELVARYNDGHRGALRRCRVLQRERFWFCLRPRRAANTDGSRPLRHSRNVSA
jgi:ribosomal protein S12 methylthiotransferase accessory factor